MAAAHKRVVGCDFRVDFQLLDYTTYYKGTCFEKKGLKDTLETSDYGSVDIVSSFIGANEDAYCGLFETAQITKIFIKYVDVFDCIYIKCLSPD